MERLTNETKTKREIKGIECSYYGKCQFMKKKPLKSFGVCCAKLFTVLNELEDRFEKGLAFDLTDGRFIGNTAFVSRDSDYGFPMLSFPVSEEEAKTLIENGIEDDLDSCIVLK